LGKNRKYLEVLKTFDIIFNNIKRRLRPRQPGRLSKVLKDVAKLQLSSQDPSPNLRRNL
tara:strand:+ start:257 stop:433 length:177 start_codon:yes stop_codon:yes gene_type:complete